MALLFPIGTMQSSSNSGVIDTNYTYSMFEPNGLCDSKIVFSNVKSNFQNQTMFVRKVALPFLSISYAYDNIFAREFDQIEHFIKASGAADGGATSFYVIDFSKGECPTNVTAEFKIVSTNTTKYSAVTNQKSNNVFFWDGIDWKLGAVATVTATQVFTNVTTLPYGAMTGTTASADEVWTYPVYTCYLAEYDFKSSQFVPSKDADRGYMKSGNMAFVSKYKV